MKRTLAFTIATTAVLAAGCSIANTTAADVALQYEGGPLDSKAYYSCVPSSTREINDVSDTHYYYPAGQRDFTFGNAKGMDSAALTSTTRDSQEISVSGTIKFTLNTSCSEFTDPTGKKWPGGVLQFFHELIGMKYSAANEDGGKPTNGGWNRMVSNYVGAALDRATDNEALNYDWQKLYADTATKAKWEKDVLNQLPSVLKSLTQGVDVFKINAVLLQKPGIAPKLSDGLTEKQAAQLRAQAADVDKQAAANFPGGIAGYQQYQQQQAINEAIKSGRVKVLPVPQGSPVIVDGK
jgi:uncharacterized ParB-like nuclease family protein